MIYLNKKPLLEDSFNSFVRTVDIAFALTEAGPGGALPPNNQPRERDKWVDKLMDNHYKDIKDLKATTQNLKELLQSNRSQSQYEKEMLDRKMESMKDLSYEPMTITKKTRPFTSYSFPFNILYLTKQIFVWIGNFLTKAFAKMSEIVASLTGNKIQTTISLAKDAFVKEEEFMKGTYLPIAFKSERESIERIGDSQLITYGSRIDSKNKYGMREDADGLLSEGYNRLEASEQAKFKVYNMQDSLTELKKYLATFLQFFDSSRGSLDENLLGVEDIETLYSLFHDQLEAIKVIKSGGSTPNKSNLDINISEVIKKSYAQLEFRVDPYKTKVLLDTTLKNTDELKKVYKVVEKKIVDVLGELLEFQNNLMRQTGTIYSAFSGETMSEMILLISTYEERIADLKSQIKSINDVKNKLNNLLKGFSSIQGLYNGFNIAQTGNWQIEDNSDIIKISNDLRSIVVMYIQVVQLRYDNAYRYLDVLSSIKDLILSVSSINGNRKIYGFS